MHRFRTGTWSVVALVLLCALWLAPESTIRAADAKPPAAHDTLNGFRLSGRFGYFKDGNELRRARVYHSVSARAYLIANIGRQDALLLRTSNTERALEVVPLEDLISNEDGSRALKRSARIKAIGKYFTQNGEIRLEAKNLNGALRSKPNLAGWKTDRDLREHKPEYGYGAVSVRSNPAKIKALKARKNKIVIKVYFGSWCTECDKVLPYILHLDAALRSARNIQFQYYAIPKRETFKQDPQVVKNKVISLPTGIIYVDGKEANRVIQKEWTSPATVVDAIVATYAMQHTPR